MEPKKIGVMGCGAVAGYGHLPAIQQTSGLQLHALYDPDPAALKAAQERFAVTQAFTDPGEFLAAELDAVSITSPAPCHRTNVLDAARHGLPVICEKPLAMDRAEAADMIAAMDSAGLSLYTAFCYRFSPSALAIRDCVRSGAIGRVRAIRLIYNWACHGKYVVDADGNRSIQQRREGRMLEGGPMIDCGTHQIDLALFWLGSPVVQFDGHGAWVEDYEAPDHMWLHLDHACGAHTVVEISYSYCHTTANRRSEFVYELIGSEGVLRYDRSTRRLTLDDAVGTRDLPFHGEKHFSAMYAEWEQALRTDNSELLTGAADGMRVIEIARAATDAAMSKRPTA